MPTKERIAKVKKILSLRQPDLRVVLEDIENTHNASAVVRTCDAAGILYVDIISTSDVSFPVNEAISTRSEKWLSFCRYTSTAQCLRRLKEKGFQIISTHLGPGSIPYSKPDYTVPTAVVFGNEADGISTEARGMSDHVVRIPMFGMAQSLNLSVSVGIIIYEAVRQREKKGLYASKQLSPEEFKFFLNKWLRGKKE